MDGTVLGTGLDKALSGSAENHAAYLSDVLAAASGDGAAFERLVAAHQTLVCSIALAVSRDLEASEEIAQEAFVQAWQGLRKLRSPESFRPWLRQITRNRAHQYIRDCIRQRKQGGTSLDLAMDTADGKPNVRQQMIDAEERKVLRGALDDLPEETREIFVLFYREEQSIQQVAKLLDITVDTVKKRLSRGRERLRQDMEKRLSYSLSASVPTAAFTGAVMAITVFGAPVTATAAGFGLAAKATGPAAAASAVLAGVFVGIAGGLAAVAYSLKRDFKSADDEKERRGLRRIAWISVANVLLFEIVGVGSWHMYHSPALALTFVTVYWVVINWTFYYRYFRVTARRRNLEHKQNPDLVAKARRRLVLGTIVSLFVYALVMAGMIYGFHLKGFL